MWVKTSFHSSKLVHYNDRPAFYKKEGSCEMHTTRRERNAN